MDVDDVLPIELPTNNVSLTRAFYLFVLIPTILGAVHHVDHIIRGNQSLPDTDPPGRGQVLGRIFRV
jgi:hypothetical protein